MKVLLTSRDFGQEKKKKILDFSIGHPFYIKIFWEYVSFSSSLEKLVHMQNSAVHEDIIPFLWSMLHKSFFPAVSKPFWGAWNRLMGTDILIFYTNFHIY